VPEATPCCLRHAPPHAITTGTSGMVILSPTPPVECLSTNASGLPSRRRSVKSSRSPEPPWPLSSGRSRAGHPPQEDRHQQRRHLLVGDPVVGIAIDHPVDRRIRQHPSVALGPDDCRGVECEVVDVLLTDPAAGGSGASKPRRGASASSPRASLVGGLTKAPPAINLSARPAARMFLAALWSRSCTAQQAGHCQALVRSASSSNTGRSRCRSCWMPTSARPDAGTAISIALLAEYPHEL